MFTGFKICIDKLGLVTTTRFGTHHRRQFATPNLFFKMLCKDATEMCPQYCILVVFLNHFLILLIVFITQSHCWPSFVTVIFGFLVSTHNISSPFINSSLLWNHLTITIYQGINNLIYKIFNVGPHLNIL